MRHIAVLGPNPAWQKTLFFDRFQYDGINAGSSVKTEQRFIIALEVPLGWD